MKLERIIELLDEQSAKEVAAQAGIPEYMATLSIFQALLKEPIYAKNLNDLLTSLIFKSNISHRLRELIIMRVAWLTSSVYEWTQHYKIALSFGVSEQDILGVRDPDNYDSYSAAEKVALQGAQEFVTQGEITATTMALLRNHYPDDKELIDLVASIAAWAMVAGLLKSFNIPLEPGVEGWPPDGISPINLNAND